MPQIRYGSQGHSLRAEDADQVEQGFGFLEFSDADGDTIKVLVSAGVPIAFLPWELL